MTGRLNDKNPFWMSKRLMKQVLRVKATAIKSFVASFMIPLRINQVPD
jgi:hypothetical protein